MSYSQAVTGKSSHSNADNQTQLSEVSMENRREQKNRLYPNLPEVQNRTLLDFEKANINVPNVVDQSTTATKPLSYAAAASSNAHVVSSANVETRGKDYTAGTSRRGFDYGHSSESEALDKEKNMSHQNTEDSQSKLQDRQQKSKDNENRSQDRGHLQDDYSTQSSDKSEDCCSSGVKSNGRSFDKGLSLEVMGTNSQESSSSFQNTGCGSRAEGMHYQSKDNQHHKSPVVTQSCTQPSFTMDEQSDVGHQTGTYGHESKSGQDQKFGINQPQQSSQDQLQGRPWSNNQKVRYTPQNTSKGPKESPTGKGKQSSKLTNKERHQNGATAHPSYYEKECHTTPDKKALLEEYLATLEDQAIVEKYKDDKPEDFEYFFRSWSVYSQWYKVGFTVDDNTYNCAEQFMMHKKATLFGDEKIAQKTLKCDDPRKQKSYGREVANFDEGVWQEHCMDIVEKGSYAKFTQNSNLMNVICSTWPKILVEASPNDGIWGIGLTAEHCMAWNRASWCGENRLGKVLTKVRNKIMSEKGLISEEDCQRNTKEAFR